MAEDLEPSLEKLPPLMRRKSERHESHKLSEDFDWESSWTKRSLMDGEEPLLPMFDQMRFGKKTAPNTPNPKGGEFAKIPDISPGDNIAMIPIVDVCVAKSGETQRTMTEKKLGQVEPRQDHKPGCL